MTFPSGKTHGDTWIAADAAERDAIGSNESLRVGDICVLNSDGTRHQCVSVDGGDSSTWATASSAVASTLSQILTAGDVTDNQPIRGTNAATAALSALSLIAGTPTNASEIGARALLQGGGGSSGAVVGGIAEVVGGPPPAGRLR